LDDRRAIEAAPDGALARIKEERLAGRYQPAPVRGVEIPKPGGKGMRLLGIPTRRA
jgi:retron-type reverse transcriptase